MKIKLKFLIFIFTITIIGCGGKEDRQEEKFSYEKKSTKTETVAKEEMISASKRVDLTTNGVGPITYIELSSEINQAMARQGEVVFKKMCAVCHRVGRKFIGPAPNGITKRRNPEWIMNMIMNPEEMVQNDALAKELLIEFNGSPMLNQNVSEEDARAILEYFRTLE